MKKMILMALLAVAVTTSVKAQYEPGKWSFKPTIAIGFANISNMQALPLNATKLDRKVAPAARTGLIFEYQAAERLGIEAGLTYGMQGCAWDDYKAGDEKLEELGVELQYIQVPIVANVYLVKGLALKAGVQLSFLTDADIKFTTEGKTEGYKTTPDTRGDITKDCNKFDVAIPVGLSYEFKNHWVIDATYNIGLTKLNKESKSGEGDNKNGALFIGFGYKFSL